VPGAIVGGIVGWFIIHPVNWCWEASPRFNCSSIGATRIYGKSVGWTLRLSVIVLVSMSASSA